MGERLIGRVLRRLDEAARFGIWPRRALWDALRGRVTVLLYHRVTRHGDRPWLESGGVPTTRPAAFDEQLLWMQDNGAKFFTFNDLREGRFPCPAEPGFVITFDDGFVDAFTEGRRCLEEHGVKGVFFVTAGMVEPSQALWEHRLLSLIAAPGGRSVLSDRLSYHRVDCDAEDLLWVYRSLLTIDQCEALLAEAEEICPAGRLSDLSLYPSAQVIREAVAAGHEIGSHGVTHRMRHLLSREQFVMEARGSREALEEIARAEVRSFSYPFNSYLWGDDELCSIAGFRTVATVDGGRYRQKGDMLSVPRLSVHGVHNRGSAFRRLVLEETGPVGPAPRVY